MDQHLDRRLRQLPPDLADAAGEDLGAAVRQIVAVDAGDHDVLQAHLRHRVGEAGGLAQVQGGRGPMGHRAIGAVAGAYVAEDHERGGVVLPALPDVGAVRLLAHRMQLQAPHHLLQGDVVGAARSLDLEPGGFALARRLSCGELGEWSGHAELKIVAAGGVG